MFTGIVEEVGRLRSLRLGSTSARLEVAARTVLEGTAVGDSIMTDGVCLTVTSLSSDSFSADAMPETVRRTTLGRLRPGARLNLERSLTPVSRIGGHFVTGHVDAVGVVGALRQEEIALWLEIEAPPEVLRLAAPRGSIAVAGVSLTVVASDRQTLTVSLIPQTRAETTLGEIRQGDAVNLEADVLARYVRHLSTHEGDALGGADAGEGAPDGAGLNWDRLAEAGFE
jgi:riboflavin synthase